MRPLVRCYSLSERPREDFYRVTVKRVRDASGKVVYQFPVKDGYFSIPVAPGQDGKVWSLDNVVAPNQTVEFLNAPQVFSLDANTLMVPADALH